MAIGRRLKITGYVIAAAAVLLIAALLTVESGPFRRYALRQIVSAIAAQGLDLRASSLDYQLAEGRVVLRDIVIRSQREPDLPPIARADRLAIDVKLRSLLSDVYVLENLLLDNPTIHVIVSEAGRNNIPQLPTQDKQKEQSDPAKFLLRHGRVTGASLRYDDRRNQISLALPRFGVTVEGKLNTLSHDIEVESLAQGLAVNAGRTLPLDRLSGNATLGRDSLRLHELALKAGDTQVNASGTLREFSDPTVDMNVRATLGLAQLAGFAAPGVNVAGTVQFDTTAQGKFHTLLVESRLQGDQLRYEQFRQMQVSGRARYDTAAKHLEVATLRVNAPFGALLANGVVTLNPASTSKVSAKLINVSAPVLMRILGLQTVVATKADGIAALSFPGIQVQQASGTADLTLRATQQKPTSTSIPASGTIQADFRNGSAVVNIGDLRAFGATADGRVAISQARQLSGSVRAQVSDLERIADALQAFQKSREPVLPTEVHGPATLRAQLAGTLESPVVDITVQARNATVGTVSAVDVDLQARYTPKGVAVQNAQIRLPGQNIQASGTVETTGRTTRLNLRSTIQDVSLADALEMAGVAAPIPGAGRVSADVRVSGTTSKPEADINFRVRDLYMYGEPFGSAVGSATLRNQVFRIAELRLDKTVAGGSGGTLTASGEYNLSSKGFQFKLDADDLHINSMSLPGGTSVSGVFNVEGSGSGTANDPNAMLRINARDLTIQRQQVGDAVIAMRLRNQIARIEARLPRFDLAADADVGIKEPYQTQFNVNADGTDLGLLPLGPDKQIAGAVTFSAHGAVPLQQWRKGEAQVRVDNFDATFRGQRIRTEGVAVAGFKNGVLEVQNGTVLAPGSRLRIEGALALSESASATGLRIEGSFDLSALSAFAPPQQQLLARGVADLQLTLHGSLEKLAPEGTLVLKNGYMSTSALAPPVTNINIDAVLNGAEVELRELSANWAQAIIRAQGTLPLSMLPASLPVASPTGRGLQTTEVSVEVQGLSLEAIEALPDQVGGTMSLHANVRAPRLALEAITGELIFDRLEIALGVVPIQQVGNTRVAVSNGTARVEQFELAGPETRLQVSGTAALTGVRALDLRASGNIDAAIVSAFMQDAVVRGATELQLTARGTIADPDLRGFLALRDGQFAISNPTVAASDLDARVEMNGTRVQITALSGALNGGTLSGRGGFTFAGGSIRDSDVKVQAQRVYMNFPEGLRTLSTANIALTTDRDNLVLGGQVNILEGGYNDRINLEGSALRFLRSNGQTLNLTQERDPLLERLRFDVGVQTASPVLVDNNLAKAAIDLDIRLVGGYYRPSITGRAEIEEGGELELRNRRYLIDRGIINFLSEARIAPSFDVLARTEAADYEITLAITGELGNKIESTFTSDPQLPEPDIIALLVTGRTLDEARGSEGAIVKEQALALLAGGFTTALEQVTGLSVIRLEPTEAAAAEANPVGRLAVGQDITRKLSLLFSINLRDSSDQIIIADYDISRRFTTTAVRQSDNSYRFEFRHQMSFGMDSPNASFRRAQRVRVGSIDITAENMVPEQRLRDAFKLEPGDEYDFFKVRRGVERVQNLYRDRGMLESQVDIDRKQQPPNAVELQLRITPGPRIEFVYEGWDPPGDVRNAVRDLWARGVFDAQRTAEARQAIRNHLVARGFLQPEIQADVRTSEPGQKRVVFTVATGAHYRDIVIEFPGATAFDREELLDLLEKQKLMSELHSEPDQVSSFIERYYQEFGYLNAKVAAREYEYSPEASRAKLIIRVNEGPLFRVGEVTFSGNQHISDQRLLSEMLLKPNDRYQPEARVSSFNKVQDIYWAEGFLDADIDATLTRREGEPLVDIRFRIDEHKQRILRDIRVEGNDITDPAIVKSQFTVKPGDVVNNENIAETRRKLYNVGAYRLVDIRIEPVEGDSRVEPYQIPVRATVRVEEVAPYQIRYGGFYDTDRGPGGIADFSARNVLGAARVIGLRTRADRRLQESRLYFTQPQLSRFPLQTAAAAYYVRDERGLETPRVVTDRIGFSVQEETRWREFNLLSFGYRIERTRSYGVPDPELRSRQTVAPLTATFTRETRNNFLDSYRGVFTSHAIEYGAAPLGSDLHFYRYFGQYFRYVPLSKPTMMPLSAGDKRPRFVFAGGVRLGLASGLGGQTLPATERFFTGGGTSVRGFAQDEIGPRNPDGIPLGGDALFVINTELRFPMWWIFDGVGFVDMGNVYRHVDDFRPWDLRKSVGAGLRVRSPWFLLRMDYGVKINRLPGEDRGKFFFSIGQAF